MHRARLAQPALAPAVGLGERAALEPETRDRNLPGQQHHRGAALVRRARAPHRGGRIGLGAVHDDEGEPAGAGQLLAGAKPGERGARTHEERATAPAVAGDGAARVDPDRALAIGHGVERRASKQRGGAGAGQPRREPAALEAAVRDDPVQRVQAGGNDAPAPALGRNRIRKALGDEALERCSADGGHGGPASWVTE